MERKRSRICYSNPTILMKRPVAQIATKMAKKYEVTVLTPRTLGNKRDKALHYSGLEKVRVLDYPTVSMPILWDWPVHGLFFPIKAWRILKKNDVVHMWVPFYLSNFTLSAMKLLFFKNTKLILTMDTVPAYSFSLGKTMDKVFKLYYKTLCKLVFKACDQITLYGSSFKKYAKQAGIPFEKLVITPTGVDVKVKKKDKDIRKELKIKKTDKIVLFAGLLIPRKGIDTIIKVASLVKDPKVKFVLVGDGPNREEYEREVKERKLRNKVLFTGFRRDIHNFYNEASVFFLPARGEGLAGVIMESMAYGVPLVVSKIPGNTDLVENNENGLVCRVESPEEYARSIQKLLTSEALGKKFIKNSKEKIRNSYSWDKNIKAFEKLYS